jgi:hypothetical protein
LFSAVAEAPSGSGGSGGGGASPVNQPSGQSFALTPTSVNTRSTRTETAQEVVPGADNSIPSLNNPAGVTKTEIDSTPSINEQYGGIMSLIAGAILVVAAACSAVKLFGAKFDVLLLATGPHRRKITKIIKRRTKIAASDDVFDDVFNELADRPLLLIEGISKGKASAVVAALKAVGGDAKIRQHRISKKKK